MRGIRKRIRRCAEDAEIIKDKGLGEGGWAPKVISGAFLHSPEEDAATTRAQPGEAKRTHGFPIRKRRLQVRQTGEFLVLCL